MLNNLFVLTASLAATASAFDCSGPYFSFYNRAGNALSYQRLDPALFPGTESPHLHSFDGGNGLAASMGFDTTQGSSCTTARIKLDKSLYWRPTLYWNGNNTGFYRVPDKYLKIYYKFGDSGNVRANVTEFPEDFKMIAGDPFKRSDDGNNPGGIKWSCKGENYASIDAVGFPKGFTSCKEGLATEITFPSCWNGNAIEPSKPTAHMAWPTAGGTGIDACPDGFKQARFPTIFIEFWYDVSSFDGQYSADSVPWVLANGDPTGFGFHADFLNGWEKGVLAKATAETGYCNCGCGCGNDQMKTCFGADNVNDDSDADFKSCSANSIFSGDDGSKLEKLAGCNPIQSGPAEATQATDAECNAVAAATSVISSVVADVSSVAADISSVVAGVSSALPTISIAVPQKQAGDGGYSGEAPSLKSTLTFSYKPFNVSSTSTYTSVSIYTPTAISDGGSLGLVFSDDATNPPSLVAPTNLPSLSAPAGGCPSKVFVTVTPTVTVTVPAAVAYSTSFTDDLTTSTIIEYTTVTVTAAASGSYKHKRHGGLHHKN